MQIWNHLHLNVTPGDGRGQQVLLESDTVQVASSSEYHKNTKTEDEECKTIQLRISAGFHILIRSF